MDSEPNCLKIVLLEVSFKDVYSAHPKLIFKYIYYPELIRFIDNQTINQSILRYL